jgi:hypothetical protein
VTASAVLIGAVLSVPGATASNGREHVAVAVPRLLNPSGLVTISFRPKGDLPRRGYYYALAVLHDYSVGTYGPGREPPPTPRCAISSDMSRTPYGYASGRRVINLTLHAAPSSQARWCVPSEYIGAVYAVPHPPLRVCSATYPCAGRTSEYGRCSEPQTECRPYTGVLPFYVYSYPGGLPKPADRSARVVGSFTLHFEAPPAVVH